MCVYMLVMYADPPLHIDTCLCLEAMSACAVQVQWQQTLRLFAQLPSPGFKSVGVVLTRIFQSASWRASLGRVEGAALPHAVIS